ncbi:MAG: cell division protein ZapA [Muribaculaceae bacterium]|nr:cell division protein ZapA [Muribaculaceae bacterium]
MATTGDNVKIEIFIAGEPIMLTVPFDRQVKVRDCEREINALYSDWRARFPRKTSLELLAMIAYQYASFFQELTERYDRLTESLRITSESLDDMLNSVSE